MTTPVDALMDAYSRAHFRYGAALDQAVARRFLTIGGVDDASAATFADAVSTTAAAGRAGVARLTSNYLGRQVAMLVDGEIRTVDIPPEDLATPVLRSGLEDVELWLRPVIRARTALAGGGTWHEALAAGRAAAHEIATTDVALAQRAATRMALAGDDRVTGYRRVPGWRSCQLCSLAADRIYHVRDLMPIHARCGCTVSAVADGRDPGHRRNEVVSRITKPDLPDDYVIDLTTEIAPSLVEVNA